MGLNNLRFHPAPIQFGTDGWRGVLGVDITIERLLRVASAAAQELAFRSQRDLNSKTVLIGYDRRFLAPELAIAVGAAVRGCELDPLITETSVPTPACSWSVIQRNALGAIVITASHNPPEWIGLKIKGPNGASVERDFTNAVEKRLTLGSINFPLEGLTKTFDCKYEHIQGLRSKFDIPELFTQLKNMGLKIIVDPMHGSAAGCMKELLEDSTPIDQLLTEIRSNRDPLFGGTSPEPLEKNLTTLIDKVQYSSANGKPAMGLVFDGDGDRIAAIDERGRFCSTQLLMPLLINHLAKVRNLPGCVVKTVSGSDLMSLVAQDVGRDVVELPVGFKYIASEMFKREVLIGGEESGGIGFGMHLPERDALFAALLLLEAIKDSSKFLGVLIDDLENNFGKSYYERIDLRLPSMNSRKKLEDTLKNNPPSSINNFSVIDITSIDGFKLRMSKNNWLMFRFSGTEPLLRIYCEAPTEEILENHLQWGKHFSEK